MFCKWCGEPVKAGIGKCPDCGRELPVLSDCGGFYDLVPEAGERPATQVPPTPVPQKTAAKGHESLPRPKKEMPSRRWNHAFLLIAVLVGLVLILLTNLSMNKKLSALRAQNQGLMEQFDCLQAEATKETEIAWNEKLASFAQQFSAIQAQKPLVKKDVAADIVFDGDAVQSVGFDLQGTRGEVNTRLSMEEAQGRKAYTVQYSLENDLAFTATWKLEEGSGDAMAFCVDYTVENEELLGKKSQIQYIWQWRERELASWKDLVNQEGTLSITDDTQSSRLDILSPAKLAQALHCDTPEFRCVIVRENEDGGKLTISIRMLSPKPETDNFSEGNPAGAIIPPKMRKS